MPSTQYGRDYFLFEKPIFIGNIQTQDKDGNCRSLVDVGINRITMTHRFFSGVLPIPPDSIINGIYNLPVPLDAYLLTPVVGANAASAFLHSGMTAFDYNFIYVPESTLTFFPQVGVYHTTFLIQANDGMLSSFLFKSFVRRLSISVVVNQPIRVVSRVYTKIKRHDGTVETRWALPSDFSTILCTIQDSAGNVVFEKTYNPTAVLSESLITNPCMFMDGTPQFDYNFQILFDNFASWAVTGREYFLKITGEPTTQGLDFMLSANLLT